MWTVVKRDPLRWFCWPFRSQQSNKSNWQFCFFFLKWQTTVIARMYLAVGIIDYGSIFYIPM